MIVSVKLLQGGECSLEVSESDLVSRLKELVERELKVPSEQQRLLFKGKPLMGEHLREATTLERGPTQVLLLEEEWTSCS
ncbi:unnamed protein product [Lampetra fluviatilis]